MIRAHVVASASLLMTLALFGSSAAPLPTSPASTGLLPGASGQNPADNDCAVEIADAGELCLPAMSAAVGRFHSCVLTILRTIDCWGGNAYGQAEDITLADTILSEDPLDDLPAAIDAGALHTCVLFESGDARCWGYSGARLDHDGGNATAVVAGDWFTCLLFEDGNAKCGSDRYAGGNAIAIGAGWAHWCYLLSTGNADCRGVWEHVSTEVPDYLGGDAIGVSGGDDHTCILKSSGDVTCPGRVPTSRGGGDAVAIDSGLFHACALTEDGNVDCWKTDPDYSASYYGQQADYTGGDAVAVFAGGFHTCVARLNGDVVCYGRNLEAQSRDHIVLPALPGP